MSQPPPVNHATWAIALISAVITIPPLMFVILGRMGRIRIGIRRIPGIDAIDEAVGRSVEMGRPLFMTTGFVGINPLLWAVLGVMGHIGKLAARFRQRLFIPQRDVRVMAVASEFLSEVYRREGRPELFTQDALPYLSDNQFSYAAGYMGMVHREQAGACFLMGTFAAESLILAEAGQQVGAMQVAGTISYTQIPFFITTCDYVVIGEELYAAGAYLSDDPVQKGSIAGQDLAKTVLAVLMLTGVIWAAAASIKHRDERAMVRGYDVPLARYILPAPEKVEGADR